MRALFFLNFVAVGLLWLLVGYDFYDQAYGWWMGISVVRINVHSGSIIFVGLLIFGIVIASALIFAIDLFVLASRALSKPCIKRFYLANVALLLIGFVCVFLPSDMLHAATVLILGPGKHADSLLHNSIASGEIWTTKTLLNGGVLPRAGHGIVYLGAVFGQLDMIKMGIAKGEDINAHGFKADTPLHAAIANNQPKAIEVLLANGARATEEDRTAIAALVEREAHGTQ